MKTILFSGIFVLLSSTALNAQLRRTNTDLLSVETKAEMNTKFYSVMNKIFGDAVLELFAGYNLSTLSVKATSNKINADFTSGMILGLNIVGEQSKRTTAQFGLYFTGLGASYSISGLKIDSQQTEHSYDIYQKIKSYTIVLPTRIIHRFGHKRVRPYIDYGWFFAFDWSTTTKSEINYTETQMSGLATKDSYREITYEETSRSPSYLNFGLSIGAGLEIGRRLRLAVNYNHGLVDLEMKQLAIANKNNGALGYKYQSREISITLGFIFGAGKGDKK